MLYFRAKNILNDLFCVQQYSIHHRWRGSNPQGIQHLNTVEFNTGCQPTSSHLDNVRLYRSHSGVCNRLQPGKEHLGILGLPFQRLLPAEYHGKFFYLILKVNNESI